MYGKSWAAIAYAVAIALQSGLDDHHLSDLELLQIGIALVAAAAVYLAPITSNYKWVKTALMWLLAVLQAMSATLLDGWQAGDWWTLGLTAAGAVAVLLAPATSLNPSGTGNVSVPLGADA